MDDMNITFAQYFRDDTVGKITSIRATIGGRDLCVPLDPANRHYAEILRQVEAGTLVVAEAD